MASSPSDEYEYEFAFDSSDGESTEPMQWTADNEMLLLIAILAKSDESSDPKDTLVEHVYRLIGVRIPIYKIVRKSNELRQRYEQMRNNYNHIGIPANVSSFYEVSDLIWGINSINKEKEKGMKTKGAEKVKLFSISENEVKKEPTQWTKEMEMRLLVAILEITKKPGPKVSSLNRAPGIIGADIPAEEILLKTKELRQRYLISEEEILNKTKQLREKYEQTRDQSICHPTDVLSTWFEISDQIWGNDFILKEKRKKEDERKRKGKEKVIYGNWG